MFRRTIIGWVLAILLIGLPIAALVISRLAEEAPTSRVITTIGDTTPRADASGPGNAADDRIANLPTTEQALVLGKSVGPSCGGEFAFFMGTGRRDADRGDAYWSVRCADGQSYAVVLHVDKTRAASVLGCDVIKAAGMECFKHLPR